MAWIKSHQELERHPKTRKLARLLGIETVTAIGHLHCLWWWAMDYAQDGNVSRYDAEDVAEAVHWRGSADDLVSALVAAGFLDETEDGNVIHDWEDYGGKVLADAESARARANKSRAKKATQNAPTENGARNVRETCANNSETCAIDKIRKDRDKDEIRGEENTGEAGTVSVPFAEIIELWNTKATKLARLTSIRGERERLTRARWAEHPSLEWWGDLFDTVNGSAFLTGKNDRKWRATFDWLVKPANFDKVCGGNYTDAQREKKSGGFDVAAYEELVANKTLRFMKKEA